MHDGACRVPIEALPVTPERRAEARRRADRGRAAVEQALPSRVSARRIRSVADVAPFGAAREVRVATAPGRRPPAPGLDSVGVTAADGEGR